MLARITCTGNRFFASVNKETKSIDFRWENSPIKQDVEDMIKYCRKEIIFNQTLIEFFLKEFVEKVEEIKK